MLFKVSCGLFLIKAHIPFSPSRPSRGFTFDLEEWRLEMSVWKRLGTAILLESGTGNFVLKMLFRGQGVGMGVGS